MNAPSNSPPPPPQKKLIYICELQIYERKSGHFFGISGVKNTKAFSFLEVIFGTKTADKH